MRYRQENIPVDIQLQLILEFRGERNWQLMHVRQFQQEQLPHVRNWMTLHMNLLMVYQKEKMYSHKTPIIYTLIICTLVVSYPSPIILYGGPCGPILSLAN